MKELLYNYDSITDFYNDAITPTPEGNSNDLNTHLKTEEKDFRGLSIDDIQKSKYCYLKGLDGLKEIELNVDLGGSKRSYTYDEFDGDDMNYDRLLEGFPAMRKRVKTHGIGSGRLINVYVVISENCNIGYKEMLNKELEVMDNTAVSLCMHTKIELRVFNMADYFNFHRVIMGEEIGTTIKKGE